MDGFRGTMSIFLKEKTKPTGEEAGQFAHAWYEYEAKKNAQSEGIPIPEHNSSLACSLLFLPEMLERQAK